MQLVSTPGVELAREFVHEVSHNYPRGRVIVAIDGIADTAGLADTLADAFREAGRAAVRASILGFRRPRADWLDPERPGRSLYESAFDYEAFRRALVGPFRMGGSAGFQTAVFDPERDAPLVSAWVTTQADAALVVDGPFLLRPGLRGVWNYSVHLAAGEDRLASLDAATWEAHSVYLVDANPGQAAIANVDNADPERPVRTFADSC